MSVVDGMMPGVNALMVPDGILSFSYNGRRQYIIDNVEFQGWMIQPIGAAGEVLFAVK